MKTRYSRFIRASYLLSDLVLLNITTLLSGWIRFGADFVFEFGKDYYKFLFITENLAWIVITTAFSSYDFARTSRWSQTIQKTLNAVLFHSLFIFAFIVILKEYNYSRLFLGYFYVVLVVVLVIWRTLSNWLIKTYRKKGFNYRTVALVGDSPLLVQFYHEVVQNKDFGYRLIGHFYDTPLTALPHEGSLEQLLKTPASKLPDIVFCGFTEQDNRIIELSRFCDQNMVRFRYIPNITAFGARRFSLNFYENTPVIAERSEPLQSATNQSIKAVFDYLFSLLVVVLIFPWLFPLIAILIKLDSRGPVFFVQQRSGLQNKTINCIKFRTMLHGEATADRRKQQASKEDNRITKVGQFLRKTNLDELPQFLNVLKGEMSVVGPRPHMLAHTRQYRKLIDQFMVRHLIKPGITGLAQVNGCRGEIKNDDDLKRRVKFDVNYLENWSFLMDVKIIAKTVISTLFGDKNAY